MALVLLIIFGLIFQESASLVALLYLASQGVINVSLVHVSFIGATIFDVWLGHKFGNFIYGRWIQNTSFDRWINKHSKFLSKPSGIYFMIFTGVINYPWLNGAIASWLNLKLDITLYATLIGDLIMYGMLWLLVLGVTWFTVDSYFTVGTLVVTILVVMYFLHKIFDRQTK